MTSIRAESSIVRTLLTVGSAFLLCCIVTLRTFAATSLSGSLTDPTGGVVPGAAIRLVNLADFSLNETLTNSQGQFFLANLNSG